MIKISISTEYRLPGVYSRETTGPKLSTTAGGNATVAIIGPALGYMTASQQITLIDDDSVELNNKGVIADSYEVRGRNTGITYVLGQDYDAVQDADGTTSIMRHIESLSTKTYAVSGHTEDFYVAQPSFQLPTQIEGKDVDGHIIAGTVSVVDYEEGVDFGIDYHTNMFSAKSGGSITNGTTLNISYQWTTAEPIELVGEAAYGLSHKYITKDGMNAGSGDYTCKIVSCKYGDNEYGDTPGADDGYIENIDFVVDYTTGKISRTASSRIPTFSEDQENYFYIEYAYCAIKSEDPVVVTYSYIDDDYNLPKFYSSYNELMEDNGSPWNTTTGEIQSPLSLAAYLATKNGLSFCYAVAVKGVTAEGSALTYPLSSWDEAFDSLSVVDNIDIIVVLSGEFEVWESAVAHINMMKENDSERVAIIGADGSENVISSSSMINYAQSLDNDDVWLVSPSSFRMRNPITANLDVIPGYYAAACVAGYNSSVPQYMPLTHKTISGLYSANEYNTKAVKRNECANGLMYIDETSSGAMKILHGRSTSTASILEQETNIVLTKYYLIKTLRNVFSNGYIGTIITPNTLAHIRAAATSVLSDMVDNNYINNYVDLTAVQNAANPTQVDISFEYIPVYGMNYIEIAFSVDGATVIE